MSEPPISQRKADHIDVTMSGKANFRHRTTLLEDVHLVHQSLPEVSVEQLDLSCTLAGNQLQAPVVISGMTGGTASAATINRDLAIAAERTGIAFGVGSQRAMAEHSQLAETFQVRDVAPNVVLFGNIGVVQARQLGADRVAAIAESISANAMVVHLNPAMELIQEDGDRDFRGCTQTIADLVNTLPIPVIVKETGSGLSVQAAQAIWDAGVRTVDVSGAGGTSWVGVETHRAKDGSLAESLGELLWDWGIPTAVSAAACASVGHEVIATGGMRSGLDVAQALALGARAGGFAAPALKAQQRGGVDAVIEFVEGIIAGVRTVSLLCACQRPSDLANAPRHLGPTLRSWLDDLGIR